MKKKEKMLSKMSKTIKFNLVVALIFTVTTLFALFFTIAFIVNSLLQIHIYDLNQSTVVFDNFLYYASFLSLILTCCFAGAIIPFDILLLKKHHINTWYTKTLLVFAGVVIAVTLLLAFSLPAIYTFHQNVAFLIKLIIVM